MRGLVVTVLVKKEDYKAFLAGEVVDLAGEGDRGTIIPIVADLSLVELTYGERDDAFYTSPMTTVSVKSIEG